MKKILIIEDEPSIAELEKDYLELSNFEVQIEQNGRVGLKRALEEEFDMFILDLMLPDMDGFDICREKNIDSETYSICLRCARDACSYPLWVTYHY